MLREVVCLAAGIAGEAAAVVGPAHDPLDVSINFTYKLLKSPGLLVPEKSFYYLFLDLLLDPKMCD